MPAKGCPRHVGDLYGDDARTNPNNVTVIYVKMDWSMDW